jgi:hypothetical protein
MRTKKRLKWSREEDSNGVVLYKAKRKTEQAIILPQQEGGYAVIYKSSKSKKKAIVDTLNEGKEVAENFRATKYKRRNPLVSNIALASFGIGIAGTLLVSYLINKSNQAQTQTLPGSPNDVYVTITPGVNTTSWTSGTTLYISLPTGAHGWVSFNGSVTSGTQAIQLPDNPVGTFTIVYQDSNFAQQTATLTVTAQTTQPGV